MRTYVAAAAAAESLQSCPTLHNPIDSSPPGSPVPVVNTKSSWLFSVGRKADGARRAGRTAFTGTKRDAAALFTIYTWDIHVQAGVCFPRATCPRPCKNLESGRSPGCLQPSGPQTGRQTNTNKHKPGGSPNTRENGEGLPEQKPSSGSPQGQNSLLIESTGQHIG